MDIDGMSLSLLFSSLSSPSSQPARQSPCHLCGPSLDTLQYAHVSLVLQSPELDTALVASPKCLCRRGNLFCRHFWLSYLKAACSFLVHLMVLSFCITVYHLASAAITGSDWHRTPRSTCTWAFFERETSLFALSRTPRIFHYSFLQH